jgi:hypothetical protein
MNFYTCYTIATGGLEGVSGRNFASGKIFNEIFMGNLAFRRTRIFMNSVIKDAYDKNVSRREEGSLKARLAPSGRGKTIVL